MNLFHVGSFWTFPQISGQETIVFIGLEQYLTELNFG